MGGVARVISKAQWYWDIVLNTLINYFHVHVHACLFGSVSVTVLFR